MATLTKEKTKKPVNTEVGIIGQMYEERKSNKVGVLESRDEKYKTLLMRDNDGKSFNINYSTFRSNWRKYSGEEIVQTSTQVKEERAKEEKRKKDNKKVVEKKPEVVKMTTEQKVKMRGATKDIVEDKVKAANIDLKITTTSKGGINVISKRTKYFEVWVKYDQDKYDFVVKDDVRDVDAKKLDNLVKTTKSEYIYKDKWVLKHVYRVPMDAFDTFLDALIEMTSACINTNTTKEE